jgi:chorismate dehydratase
MGWSQPDNSTGEAAGSATGGPVRIGCVSYLNAKPLIDGLEAAGAAVRYDVPGRLLEALETGAVDVALCPIIDYYRAASPLELVPAGGIGCAGPTLTVRLFSRVPLAEVTRVNGDSDSHTSVALLKVLMAERFGRSVEVVSYDARNGSGTGELAETSQSAESDQPEAVLLIGDKVVTAAPDSRRYPFTLDLGATWHAMTGLPFVFAAWLARPEAALGDWPSRLEQTRRANQRRLETIVEQYATAHGWPVDQARRYLTSILQYEIDEPQLAGVRHFASLAAKHGIIDEPRALKVTPLAAASS